jgi:peptide chain release factor-like protein
MPGWRAAAAPSACSVELAPSAAVSWRRLSYRQLSDEALSAQCRWEAFRARGPGGQHRDKTNTAVRVTHLPSGISATGGESRSARENRIHALRRLRLKLALEIRQPIDRASFAPPQWFIEARHLLLGAPASRAPTLKLTPRHHAYFQAVGLVMDVLTEMRGDMPASAAMLGVSTSSFMRFIEQDGQTIAMANRLRTGSRV